MLKARTHNLEITKTYQTKIVKVDEASYLRWICNNKITELIETEVPIIVNYLFSAIQGGVPTDIVSEAGKTGMQSLDLMVDEIRVHYDKKIRSLTDA